MAKFLIEPHFRLQEWVAEEKGYFRAEGLDYEFREMVRATGGQIHNKGDKVGAFQSFEEGRKSNVSCACHWTVNVAASNGHGRCTPTSIRSRRRAFSCRRFARSKRRPISPACRSRSATSPAVITPPFRRWSLSEAGPHQAAITPTACCSRAWSS